MSEEHRSISVGALVPYYPDTAPSQRFRLEQWMPYLEGEGIAVDLIPFASARLTEVLHQSGHWIAKAVGLTTATLHRVFDVARLRKYDVILIHRALSIVGPALLERILPSLGRPVIFDFDDAIWLLDTTRANRHFGWLKFPGKTATICRISAHVIVGNRLLGEYARQFNRNVTVIPSSVDTERFKPQPAARSDGRMVIGWTGSSTSQAHLEMFAPSLRELFQRRDVELRIISDRKPEITAVPFVWVPWNRETESQDLAPFDIGIMPIPDDRWARGKCALKALLYMAMGIPCVISAVGTNCEVVSHGENGLLATTPEQWTELLLRLTNDQALRERLGAAARRTVEQRYSMIHCAKQFADVVRRVAPHMATRAGDVHVIA